LRWLRRKIRELYSERCPDSYRGCPVCDAWSVYDTMVEDHTGELDEFSEQIKEALRKKHSRK